MVQSLVQKWLLNHIVTLESLLLEEKKICFAPKIWYQERVFTEKKELALMYEFIFLLMNLRMPMALKLNIEYGILSAPK